MRPISVYFAAKHKRLIPAWILHFGVFGVFAVSFVDASPIPLPIPGSTDVLILILGAHGEWPWLLALAGVAGSVLGGYVTWATGKKGGEAMLDRTLKKRQRWRERIRRWMKGHGIRTVVIATLLPPPIPLLPFLLGAGALGVTRRQLLLALGIGRSIRYGVEAALSVVYGRQILRLWTRYLAGWSNIIIYCFIGVVVASVLFGIWQYRRSQHEHRPAESAA